MSWLIKSRALGAVAVAGLAAGCGFKPAGQTPLPPQMQSTYVASPTPYGDLENMLRREIARRGDRVVDDRDKATAVLQILQAQQTRRVLAVNSDGRPIEYALNYEVQFRLLDASGKELLAPQTLNLSREYAYSITAELGTTREETEILQQLQGEATRLILVRLEALVHRNPQSPPPSSLFKRLN